MTLRLVASNGELLDQPGPDYDENTPHGLQISDLGHLPGRTRMIRDNIVDGIIGITDYEFSAYYHEVGKTVSLSPAATRKAVDDLVKAGVLEEVTRPHGRRKGTWRLSPDWGPPNTAMAAGVERMV